MTLQQAMIIFLRDQYTGRYNSHQNGANTYGSDNNKPKEL